MTSFCSYISSFLLLLQEKHLVEIHKNFANNETKDSVNIMIWAGISEVNNMNRVKFTILQMERPWIIGWLQSFIWANQRSHQTNLWPSEKDGTSRNSLSINSFSKYTTIETERICRHKRLIV